MGRLHIVIDEADRHFISNHKPLVFDDEFMRELQKLNAASREIRAMGYQIDGEGIPLGLPDSRTEITLAADQNPSLLLQKSKGRWAQRIGTRVISHTEFMDVLVSWEGWE